METEELILEIIDPPHPSLIPVPMEEDITKHLSGQHDQRTHGSWANESQPFDPEKDGPRADMRYSEEFEINPLTSEENEALDEYAGFGYEQINSYLRYGGSEGGFEDNPEPDFKDFVIESIDKVIDRAPIVFGDKTLYRLFSPRVIDTLKEGDILTDKGFMSTTRRDLTDPTNKGLVYALDETSPDTDGVIGVILPNANRNGRGLSFEYLASSTPGFDYISKEAEVLLPRNTSLKFLGYDREDETRPPFAIFERQNG